MILNMSFSKMIMEIIKSFNKNLKPQPFREWWKSVSNLSRLKDNVDYEKKEKQIIKDISNKPSFA